MRCGSCSAVVAAKTLTLSPPISFASAAHSGSQAKTFTAAPADTAHAKAAQAIQGFRKMFIPPSEGMRAMRAEAYDVLQEHLAVRVCGSRIIAGELQAQAGE